MCSERELGKELDKIPASPYKPVADLRRLHELFHAATEIDEGIPHSFTSLSTEKDILEFVKALDKPTSLQQALSLVDTIQDEIIDSNFPEGSGLVLKLLLKIYISHYPPDKVKHNV